VDLTERERVGCAEVGNEKPEAGERVVGELGPEVVGWDWQAVMRRRGRRRG
jgi:hypothetical protein